MQFKSLEMIWFGFMWITNFSGDQLNYMIETLILKSEVLPQNHLKFDLNFILFYFCKGNLRFYLKFMHMDVFYKTYICRDAANDFKVLETAGPGDFVVQ